ncbi:MAG TPA: hypothetical protein VG205_13880 [Acidimicrobiales bacterium]|nr:hypothetical protein [Acidimicrobiales bacterium]
MPGTNVGRHRGGRGGRGWRRDLSDLDNLGRRFGDRVRRRIRLRHGLGGSLSGVTGITGVTGLPGVTGLGDPENCLGQLLQHHHLDDCLDDGLGDGAFADLRLRVRLPAVEAAHILDPHQRPH